MANMFGALNRFIARLDSDPNAQQSQRVQHTPGYGFQVLCNNDANLPLDPWFDFIIGINGRTIDNASPDLFATEVRNCAGATMSLGIYSAKGQQIREIYHTVPQDVPSLGLTLQWCPLSVIDHVWHILDIIPNSPADVAGLLPYSDYVIGSPENGVLRGESSLGELVEQYTSRPLRLYVYNHEYDVTRMVTLTPAKDWGGEGALGCVLGYGALHRVPAPLTEPAHAPGETLFDTDDSYKPYQDPGLAPSLGQTTATSPEPPNFLVPAEMTFASPSPSAPPPPGRAKKARAHHALTPAAGLDDYFAEGEQKSRAADNAPSPKPASAGLPPPPPKGAGGPPRAVSPAAAPAPSVEEAD